MKTRLVFILLFVGIIGFSVATFAPNTQEPRDISVNNSIENPIVEEVDDNVEVEDVIESIELDEVDVISTPEPLRLPQIFSDSDLTINGVIAWTNKYRLDDDLNILNRNLTLDKIAATKLNDMFKNQYFAHESPATGDQVGDLAKKIGYNFIIIGENLALGNFSDDKELVDAWMNSPGHRANILKDSYEEIGVAVGEGIYEGRKTWLAVQTFGKSISSCPSIDKSLESNINELSDEITLLKVELDNSLDELQSTSHLNPKYNKLVNEYNALVAVYNSSLEELKDLIETYNDQVSAFNTCASNS